MHTSATTPLKPLWPEFSYKEHQVTGIRWMMARERAGLVFERDPGAEEHALPVRRRCHPFGCAGTLGDDPRSDR